MIDEQLNRQQKATEDQESLGRRDAEIQPRAEAVAGQQASGSGGVFNRPAGVPDAKDAELSAKVYTAWEPHELWRHEQMNFAAHMALAFAYVQERGLSLDDFHHYIGEKVAPAWQGCLGVGDFMNYVLLNVVANGGRVLDTASHDGAAAATVTEILRSDVGEQFGIAPAVLNSFWDKFIPIAVGVGLRFRWERTEQGQYCISVGPK
jgi:hypothetical protein